VFRLARTAANGSKKDVPGSTMLNGVEEGGMPPAAPYFSKNSRCPEIISEEGV